MAAIENNVMRIGEGRNWSFLNGQWTDGSEGELLPPDGAGAEYLAVKHDRAYGDFSAQFRFKFRSGLAEQGSYSACRIVCAIMRSIFHGVDSRTTIGTFGPGLF